MSLLRVSDSVIGEAQVIITADDEILLPKNDTLLILKGLISEKTTNQLSDLNQSDKLSQKDFRSAGLDLTFDFSTLESVISIPIEMLQTQQLSFEGAGDYNNYLEPSLASGYLNVTFSGSQVVQKDDQSTSETSFTSSFDSAFNIGRANLEYESEYVSSDVAESYYLREGTRFNMDFPSQGTRLVLGDMYNSGAAFQDGVDLLGIGLTRDFTLIPTRNVRPRATQSFTLQRTSNVDVVLDGIVVQRLTLNAGSYNLNDIPLAQGNNDVELIITDSSGQEERLQFSVATGNDLLDSGEFEYSIAYGLPSEINGDEIDYFTDQQLIHGYIEAGVTPWLTLGINGQAREELYQYGGSILFATELGTTELWASSSHHSDIGGGEAFRFAFDASFDSDNEYNPDFSLIYDYQTENFSGVRDFDSLTTPLNTVEHYVSLFSSMDISFRMRAALSLSYSSGSEESDNYTVVGPSFSGPLFATPASWSTRFNYQINEYEDDEFYTTLTLSWPLSKATRVVARYQSDTDYAAVEASYREGIGNTGGISAYASVGRERDTDADIDAGVDYTANRMSVSASHNTRYDDTDLETQTHNSQIELSSAIAFSGTSVAIGRQVGEAFAVVTKHPSLAENNVAIDPIRNTEYARVISRSTRNVLIPDLVAYNPQLIGFDVEDLPPGYDLGEGAFSLYPGYKRGYKLQVGSDSVLTVMGNVIEKKTGKPISLIVGEAIYLGKNAGKNDPVEFFTNRNGRFAISGLRPGKYRLDLFLKDTKSIEITLPKESDALIRLGDLYVE
ncbi:fimbria/pilus outer membrane usher protein [Vibrio sp. F74]|uniref:fimbria/pilus outer membrane usher protein n=1 Tax=Vibrio sp. F74 TaxID=700020 RepID=UPI0035F53B6E